MIKLPSHLEKKLRALSLFLDHPGSQSRAYDAEAVRQIRDTAGKVRTYERKAHFMAEAIGQRFGRMGAVLEVGCGAGQFTEALSRCLPNCRIVATDAYQPMLDEAATRLKKNSNVSLQLYNGQEEFRGETFDAICGVDVIHHLDDPVGALRRWRQAVRNGGALLFLESNPANPALFLSAIGRPHERRFYLNTPGNLRRWAQEAGWLSASVENLPFYLPSGPPGLDGVLTSVEEFLHRGRRWWGRLSGLFFLKAVNP